MVFVFKQQLIIWALCIFDSDHRISNSNDFLFYYNYIDTATKGISCSFATLPVTTADILACMVVIIVSTTMCYRVAGCFIVIGDRTIGQKPIDTFFVSLYL
jgi:hypothetical protein